MGHSQRFTTHAALDTGYEPLNLGLLNRGWPLGSLVEVCQEAMQGEWLLFAPALLELRGLVVLLNPPAMPFSQALIQAGLDLDRLVVVAATDKNQFISCFVELCRASLGALLAWQPKAGLGYTELRKCQLAATEGKGVAVIFRPVAAQQQSSPASLRLYSRLLATGVEITIFKQKGYLQTQQAKPVILPLPGHWQAALPFHQLNQTPMVDEHTDHQAQPQALASVIPLRGKP